MKENPQFISVRNPENVTVLTQELINELNKDLLQGIHGSTTKYVHSMADLHNINPVNLKRKATAQDLKIVASTPEILRLPNCHVSSNMIVYAHNQNIVQQNLNSYYEWDDGFFPTAQLKPEWRKDLSLKFRKFLGLISKEKDFITRKKIAFKKHSENFFQQKNKIVEIENGMVFCDHYFYVFGHFMHENYPRLYFLISQLSEEEKRDFKLILPPKFNPHSTEDKTASYFNYIRPCLDALGIKEEQCVYLEKDSVLKVKNLLMPSQIRFHPIVKRALQHITDFYHNTSEDFSGYQKIYLSRQNAPRRKLVNESEFQKFLIEKGFKIVTLEDLDFKTQMNILENAQTVIAQDSSTLTNIIFCPNATDCIILTCDKITCPFFSTVIDARFYYQFCEPEDRKNFEWYSSNITADIQKLQENLNLITAINNE